MKSTGEKNNIRGLHQSSCQSLRHPCLGRSRGSMTVEASIVFPIVILTIIFMLTLSVKLYEKVRDSSKDCAAYSKEILNPLLSAESVLRYKWLGINIIFKTED